MFDMYPLTLYIFALVVAVIAYFLNRYFRKKYKITDIGRYQHVNHTQKRIEWIIRAMFIIAYFIVGIILLNFKVAMLLLFGYSIFEKSFRAFMEYKYARHDKLYIPNLTWTISLVVVLIGSMFLTHPIKPSAEIMKDKPFNIDTIKEIKIEHFDYDKDTYKTYEMTIEDAQTIRELFTVISEQKVQKDAMFKGGLDSQYLLYIQYENSRYDYGTYIIVVYKQYLLFNFQKNHYKVINENEVNRMLDQLTFD